MNADGHGASSDSGARLLDGRTGGLGSLEGTSPDRISTGSLHAMVGTDGRRADEHLADAPAGDARTDDEPRLR